VTNVMRQKSKMAGSRPFWVGLTPKLN